jgi:hypothetical protein
MPTARCATSRVFLTAWSQVVTTCIICSNIVKAFTISFFDFTLSVLYFQYFVLACHSFIYHQRYIAYDLRASLSEALKHSNFHFIYTLYVSFYEISHNT